MKLKLKFLEQLNCPHVWKKDVTYHQLRKDDNKVLWVCEKCHKRLERDRWEPPESVAANRLA